MSATDTSPVAAGTWIAACRLDELIVGRGVGVLGPQMCQVALFRIAA